MMAEGEECRAMLREGKAQGGSEEGSLEGAAAPEPNSTMSAAQYTRQLQEWLWQCYCGSLCWQSSCATTTAFLMMNAASSSTGESGRSARSSSDTGRATSAATTSGTTAAAGREYVIPTLAQRFRAEMVDFFILFFIKAAFILSIMHVSGIKDISKFTMHYIIEEVDEDTSMEDLQKMMVVALIYRIVVCFYEVYLLFISFAAFLLFFKIICIWGAGGATPGKFLLGLRVVTCDSSVLIGPNRVLVVPSTNVNLTSSTIRAVIKNFSIAFFFPAFITLLFFQHNRTAYDIVAGTIVVRRNGR